MDGFSWCSQSYLLAEKFSRLYRIGLISQFLGKISQIRNSIGTQARLPIRNTDHYQGLSGKTQDIILMARYMLEFSALLEQYLNQTKDIDFLLPYLDRNHSPTGNIVRYNGK